MKETNIDRRKFIAASGAATIAGLAGCLGGGDGDGGGGDERTITTSTDGYEDYTKWIDKNPTEESMSITSVDFTIFSDSNFSHLKEAYKELDAGNNQNNENRELSGKVNSIAELVPSSTSFSTVILAGFAAGTYRPIVRDRMKYSNELPELESDEEEEEEVENPIATLEGLSLIGKGYHFIVSDFDSQKVLDMDKVTEKETIDDYTVCMLEEGGKDRGFGYGGPFAVTDDEFIGISQTDVDNPMQLLKDHITSSTKDVNSSSDAARLSQHCGTGLSTFGQLNIQEQTRGNENQTTLTSDFNFQEQGVKEKDVETYTEYEKDMTGFLYTIDSSDGRRVAKSGFMFSESKTEKEANEFADAVARGASETNVLVEDDMVVIEAFFE